LLSQKILAKISSESGTLGTNFSYNFKAYDYQRITEGAETGCGKGRSEQQVRCNGRTAKCLIKGTFATTIMNYCDKHFMLIGYYLN